MVESAKAAFNYFFGSKEDPKTEDEDPVKAMQQALDGHGEFQLEEDGTLNWDSLKVLHGVVVRQANRAFNKEGRENVLLCYIAKTSS